MILADMAVENMMAIAEGGRNPRLGVITLKTLPMVPSPTGTPRTMMTSEAVVYTLGYMEGSLLVQVFVSYSDLSIQNSVC